MKNVVILCMLCVFFIACNNDDTNNSQVTDIVGTWKLIEYYADPGNGVVNFIPIVSDKTIEFNADGSLSSNADLCQLFSETGDASNGTYSELDSTYTISGCQIQPFTGSYEIINSELFFSYICIEPCVEKYIKVE
ncbi:hypothetical protein RM697_01370 [Ichthyenterobacterium sp. W332]|uniref:Lipocalin-like domain-containing protein n=1 Tax=Microcosmobacter mediterraneus TaxID=3075607 RepID=A0ABU2YHA0_9FLAO|nr:lipocalin family protein [Ichthyenterobacterium sp. W332]MDT0557276.1 hypothetical protein [Ichthyenterobacterium sp. W332]